MKKGQTHVQKRWDQVGCVFSSGQYQLHIYFMHLCQEAEFIVYKDKEVGLWYVVEQRQA